ncbi:MAG: hypothetical protein LC789_09455, partial [Actinobacteria bacterium]|nr:hypothetical protein [Actinomycetota bacterium]MCA1722613.1 hypothetical protein [Actinomycetota bacterium]
PQDRPPVPPQEPTQALSYEPTPPPSPVAGGSAAEETRRLIEELSAGQTPQLPDGPPTASSWTPAPPESGVFPPTGVPSYAPQPPASPPPAPTPQPYGALPSTPAPRAVHDEPLPAEAERAGSSRSKLLPLLLALALLLGGGYVVKTLLSGDDEGDVVTAPPVRRSPAASTAASKAAGGMYTAAQIAQSLRDPHFKHGYDYGKSLAAAGPVRNAEAACAAQSSKERAAGYPWGAHDRQGCLVATTA